MASHDRKDCPIYLSKLQACPECRTAFGDEPAPKTKAKPRIKIEDEPKPTNGHDPYIRDDAKTVELATPEQEIQALKKRVDALERRIYGKRK